MKKLSKVLLFGFSAMIACCGVKGVPQPPLTAPVLGRGEPSYSKATENVKVKKSKTKTNDWGDPVDFVEDKEK